MNEELIRKIVRDEIDNILKQGIKIGENTITITGTQIDMGGGSIINLGSPVMITRVASLNVDPDFTEVTIIGLNHERLLVMGHFHNANAENVANYRVFVNNDTTPTNYYAQILEVTGTTVSASNVNDCIFARAEPCGRAPFIIYIARPTGWTESNRYIKLICFNTYNNGVNLTTRITSVVRQVDEDVNITSLTFQCSNVSGALSSGSRIRVFNIT